MLKNFKNIYKLTKLLISVRETHPGRCTSPATIQHRCCSPSAQRSALIPDE